MFEGIEELEVANIACRPGVPDSYLVKRYYQITEKALLHNLYNKVYLSGKEMLLTEKREDSDFTKKRGRCFWSIH